MLVVAFGLVWIFFFSGGCFQVSVGFFPMPSFKLVRILLHLTGFNSPPLLFFPASYFASLPYLLYIQIEHDLFYLELWVSC